MISVEISVLKIKLILIRMTAIIQSHIITAMITPRVTAHVN